MSTDSQKEQAPRGGVLGFLKSEVIQFFSDPIGYAVDRWVQGVFVGLGLWILISAARMVISSVIAAFS
jgi:hypothetical protein